MSSCFPRIIMHIDMNSYFASVEQQANPFWRGKALGVCAYLSRSGCIIASSKEAKLRGVKTGCRVQDALRLCPDIKLVQNDPPKYRSTTEKIFSIFHRYTGEIEPYSIDEAFLDLTGIAEDFSAAEKIGHAIQRDIHREVGEWLNASVGVSFTRFLAKLAGDTAPKGSVFILSRERLSEWLSGLELTDVWGIGQAMARRLEALGIHTPEQLRNYPVANLLQALGKTGYYLWADLHGQELGGLTHAATPKSIGHSYCLPIRTSDSVYHQRVWLKLCEKTGRRLREKNLWASGVSAWWLEERNGGRGGHKKLHRAIYTTKDIFREVMEIFKRRAPNQPVTQLAMSVFSLTPPNQQLSLFSQSRKVPGALSQAVDQLNDRHGEYTVFWGEMWGTEKNAPDRVGFRKTIQPTFIDRDQIEYVPDVS